ncbi:unnamed protein product [Meganyctiphanes norvegica]|uniref:Uncharacterized protein n=1 Tax=Meganyctiphanes norvegica TaxID=48144 RepID=A0AAV2PS33_MEGNR
MASIQGGFASLLEPVEIKNEINDTLDQLDKIDKACDDTTVGTVNKNKDPLNDTSQDSNGTENDYIHESDEDSGMFKIQSVVGALSPDALDEEACDDPDPLAQCENNSKETEPVNQCDNKPKETEPVNQCENKSKETNVSDKITDPSKKKVNSLRMLRVEPDKNSDADNTVSEKVEHKNDCVIITSATSSPRGNCNSLGKLQKVVDSVKTSKVHLRVDPLEFTPVENTASKEPDDPSQVIALKIVQNTGKLHDENSANGEQVASKDAILGLPAAPTKEVVVKKESDADKLAPTERSLSPEIQTVDNDDCELEIVLDKCVNSRPKMRVIPPPREVTYSCPVCVFKSTTIETLAVHIPTHPGLNKFACPVCDYKTRYVSGFQRHMARHTGALLFFCRYCEYVSSDPDYFQLHMTIHSGKEKFYNCPVCGTTLTSKDFKEHMIAHMGTRPFPCTECCFRCSSRTGVKTHMLIHSFSKPFVSMPKPKGKMTPYACFMQEENKALQLESSAGFVEISKLWGERWKEISDEEKGKYEEMAEMDKERYAREMANWNPTPDEIYGKSKKINLTNKRGPRKKKLKTKDPNLPKRGQSAFFFYAKVARQEVLKITPDMIAKDVAKELGRKWKELSDEEKSHFNTQAEDDRKRYWEEMEIYKSNTPPSIHEPKAKKPKTSTDSPTPLPIRTAETHVPMTVIPIPARISEHPLPAPGSIISGDSALSMSGSSTPSLSRTSTPSLSRNNTPSPSLPLPNVIEDDEDIVILL